MALGSVDADQRCSRSKPPVPLPLYAHPRPSKYENSRPFRANNGSSILHSRFLWGYCRHFCKKGPTHNSKATWPKQDVLDDREELLNQLFFVNALGLRTAQTTVDNMNPA